MGEEKKLKVTNKLAATVLSLSLLTVMAGAAVAPALGVIEQYFAGESKLLVQMIISIPAVFIVITNLIFPGLCKHLKSKTLVMAGLILYTAGGCSAGLFNSIQAVLAARALVGIGVGIVMPLSTGLIAYYFPKEKQEKMMGLSSAMNQMGGVIATLLAGLLASVNWRASFLVYLMGLISIVLCAAFLPNHSMNISEPHMEKTAGNSGKTGSIKEFAPYIAAMFFLMMTFFIYPANFAIETTAAGIIPQKFISVIMASMDLVAFFGGLAFYSIKKSMGHSTRLFAPVLFLAGYILLMIPGGWAGTLAGSFLIGFANGLGIPFIISSASQKAGKAAATTVLPLISAALYLAQFLTPAILSGITAVLGPVGVAHIPYLMASATAVIFLGCSAFSVKDDAKAAGSAAAQAGSETNAA